MSQKTDFPDRDPQLFYELARDRHAAQADSLQALDNKLSFFLSSSSPLVGVLVAVYALRPNAFHALGLTLLSAGIGAWLLLTIAAVDAFRHRRWRSGPQLPYVFDLHFGDESDARLKWRVANVFWHDYNHNKKHEDRKARALTCAISLFVIQTVLLLATLLVVAVSPSSGSTRRSECPARAVRDAQAQAPAPALAKSPPAQPLAAVPHSLAADHNPLLQRTATCQASRLSLEGILPTLGYLLGTPSQSNYLQIGSFTRSSGPVRLLVDFACEGGPFALTRGS